MDIQTLKNQIKLSELIGQDVRLKKTGREYSGCCPFHQEKNPSFWVNDDKGLYYCFGCGATGDAFSYLTDKKGLHFKDAILYVADKLGITLPKSFFQEKEEAAADSPLLVLFEKAAEFFESQLTPKNGLDYLLNRRISMDMIEKFRLGFCPDGPLLFQTLKKHAQPEVLHESGLFIQDDTIPRFRQRVIFPIRNQKGQIIAFGGRTLGDDQPKYLNSPENTYFKKKETLYGFYEGYGLDKKKPYIFVEGYLDVIKLHQHGFTGAVASMGTALTPEHIQKVWRYDSRPTVCLDGDAAGQRAQLRTVEKILPFITPYKTITITSLPDQMDPDQLMDYNPIAFQKLIEAPQSVVDFLYQHFEEKLAQTKTPEEIAAIQGDMKNLCFSIAHKDLQLVYLKTLNRKFWYYLGKKILGGSGHQTPPPTKNNRLMTEILLATIMNHPIILDEVHENLGRAQFAEEDLERLRCQILDGYYNNYDVQPQYTFDQERIMLFAPFAKKTAELEAVLVGWWDIWFQLFNTKPPTTDDWTSMCKFKQIYVEGN